MPEIFNAADEPKNSSEESQPKNAQEDSFVKISRDVDEYSTVLRQYEPASNPLNAFAAKPSETGFDSQHKEEKVLLLLRQHPITQIHFMVIGFLMLIAPFFFESFGLFSFLSPKFHVVTILGWYLLTMGFILEAFVDWFYNVYIITDERVIDIDFVSLIFKSVSHAKLDKIEDITATTSGTLGTVFDYGTVRIQTAGATTEFEFAHVPHPSQVTSFLNELLVEEEREKIEGRVN